MTQEMQQLSYRGVTCLNCKEPIAISPLVASIEAEHQEAETSPPKHQKCQVFHLRCVACGKEKPYKIGEIVEFEGTPITERPRVEPTRSRFGNLGGRTRAANA